MIRKTNYRIWIRNADYKGFREALPHVELILRGSVDTQDFEYQYYVYLSDEDITFITLRFPCIKLRPWINDITA